MSHNSFLRTLTDFESKCMVVKRSDHHTVPIIPINPMEFRKTIKDSENSSYIYLSTHRIMLDDYKKAVISSYHQKKVKGLLSVNLSHPASAKLKKECLLVLNSRPQKKDEKIIRVFFNSGVISADYGSSIERSDPDRLKPLNNFLKGKTMSTEPRNIELLAWLIDFEPRPYLYGITYGSAEEIPAEPPTKSPILTSKRVPISKYGIDIVILLTIIIGGIGLSMRNARIEQSTTAYICTSKVAKKYHLNAKCHGLNNCKSQIITTTIAEAKGRGKTRCEIER